MLRPMQERLYLPQWLPITVVATLALFVVRELLEWRRRRAADQRKVKALKKIIARECRKNNSAIATLLWACEQLQTAAASQDPSRVFMTERDSGGFFACVNFGEDHTIGWSAAPVTRDALHKHLPEVAALDEDFFAECERAIDAIEVAEWIPGQLVQIKVAGPDEVQDWNLTSRLRNYQLQLTNANLANRSLHMVCTGKDAPAEDRPGFDAS